MKSILSKLYYLWLLRCYFRNDMYDVVIAEVLRLADNCILRTNNKVINLSSLILSFVFALAFLITFMFEELIFGLGKKASWLAMILYRFLQ